MGRSHFYLSDPAAPEPNRPRRIGVLALIVRDGALLLERRADAPLWSLIGGSVEDTETLTDALGREVAEETGLAVTGFELFGTFSDPTRIVSYADDIVFSIVAIAFTVSVASFDGLRASAESDELRFFPFEELLQLDLPATQRPIFECLVSGERPPFLL